jgi:hypothetical protein
VHKSRYEDIVDVPSAPALCIEHADAHHASQPNNDDRYMYAAGIGSSNTPASRFRVSIPETDVRDLQRTRVSSWWQFARPTTATHHHRFYCKRMGNVQMHRCQYLRDIPRIFPCLCEQRRHFNLAETVLRPLLGSRVGLLDPRGWRLQQSPDNNCQIFDTRVILLPQFRTSGNHCISNETGCV